MPVLEQFQCVLESKKGFSSTKTVVVRKASGCLLSGQTSVDVNFIKINVNKIRAKPTKPAAFTTLGSNKKIPQRLKPLITEYDEEFHGVGKLTFKFINQEGKPVAQPTRTIPFTIREKVESELNQLQQQDIIEHAQGPSIWVSPIVVFPKPNNPDKIRLCVDMRQPNTAILRERHP